MSKKVWNSRCGHVKKSLEFQHPDRWKSLNSMQSRVKNSLEFQYPLQGGRILSGIAHYVPVLSLFLIDLLKLICHFIEWNREKWMISIMNIVSKEEKKYIQKLIFLHGYMIPLKFLLFCSLIIFFKHNTYKAQYLLSSVDTKEDLLINNFSKLIQIEQRLDFSENISPKRCLVLALLFLLILTSGFSFSS